MGVALRWRRFGLIRELNRFPGLIWQTCNRSALALLLFGADESPPKIKQHDVLTIFYSIKTKIMQFSASIALTFLVGSAAAFAPVSVKKSGTSLRVRLSLGLQIDTFVYEAGMWAWTKEQKNVTRRKLIISLHVFLFSSREIFSYRPLRMSSQVPLPQ